MVKLDKLRVIAIQNKIPVGYIKSVSYKKGTFTLTKDKMFAKTYSSQDRAMKDIDAVAHAGLNQGYIFAIDF